MKCFRMLLGILVLFFLSCGTSQAQKGSDNEQVKEAIVKLLDICKSVDFSDPKTTELGMFYKAAPYIVYRGDSEERKWKDFADYQNPDERKKVDDVCIQLNETVNRSEKYTFGKFSTEVESEGKWYVQEILFKKNGKDRKIYLAFLKTKDKFALGDID